MDVQFEVVSRLKEQHLVQWYKFVQRKRLLWVVLFGALGVLSLVVGLRNQGYARMAYSVVCVAYSIWLYRRPWTMAKKVMKQDLEFYGTDDVENIVSFGDVIQDATKDRVNTVPYDKIQEMHVLEDLIVLKDVRNAYFIMEKNGFTKGDFQSFQIFIKEKCPQLNLPNWNVPEQE